MVTKAKSHNLTAVQVDGAGLSQLMQGRTEQPEQSPKGVFRSMIRRYRTRYSSASALIVLAFYMLRPEHWTLMLLGAFATLGVLALAHARYTHRALAAAVNHGRLEWLQARRWNRLGVVGNIEGTKARASAAPFSLAMTDSHGRVAVLRKGRSVWVLGAEMLRERFGLDYPRVKRLFPNPDQRFAVARLYGPDALIHLIMDEQETTRNRRGGVQFLRAPPAEWKGWYKPADARKRVRAALDEVNDPHVLADILRWITWKPRDSPAPLGKAIRLGDSALIHMASHLLERSKHADAEATALELLDESRVEVLAAAVGVLGSIGSGTALERLAAMRQSAEPELLRPISLAIEQLSGRIGNSTFDGRLALVEDCIDDGQLSLADSEGGLAFAEESRTTAARHDEQKGEASERREVDEVVESEAAE